MERERLTSAEWALLFESLQYTERAFRDYHDYPSYEYKQLRVAEVRELRDKLRVWRKAEEGAS